MTTLSRFRCAEILIAILACVGLTTTSAMSGTLQKNRVAADAAWMAHVDVRALAKSSLFTFLKEHGEDIGIDLDLEGMQQELGIDPLKDILGITIYGRGNPEHDENEVAVLHTTAAVDQVVESLKAGGEEAFTAVTEGGYEIGSFNDGDEAMFFHVRPGKNSQERVIVLGRKPTNVAKGLAVLDGTSPNAERGGDHPLSASPSEGSFLFFSGNDLGGWGFDVFGDDEEDNEDEDDGEKHPHQEAHEHAEDHASALLSASRSVRLDVGENAGSNFMDVNVTTDSEEAAGNLEDMAKGMLALARMAGSDDPDLKPMLDVLRSIRISAEGPSISLKASMKSADLIAALMSMSAEDEAEAEDADGDGEVIREERRIEHSPATQPEKKPGSGISLRMGFGLHEANDAAQWIEAFERFSETFGAEFEVAFDVD